jgi:hypothetical protein
LVEQRIRNAKVASSIPAIGTSNIKSSTLAVGLFVHISALMPDLPFLDFNALRTLAAGASPSMAAEPSCACAAHRFAGWQSVPLSFPEADMETIGTLWQDPFVDPTFLDYHPDRTRYESPDAPIAPRFYPYNRCVVQCCRICGRARLRYVEAGGYFVDPRIRDLTVNLLVDAPL